MNIDLFRARYSAGVAACVLVAGTLVGIGVSPALAHPEACIGDVHDDVGHDEICFTQEQIDVMDDSDAELGVDETARSHNMHHLVNVPKQPEFAETTGTDIAFTGGHAIVGNYNGFSVFDITVPARPRLVATMFCPGSQNDVSVAGTLLITSTDSSRNQAGCEGNAPQSATIKESWEGIRVFDISDPEHPRYVTAVETACGSHTHTTIPDPANGRAIVYVSSYSPRSTFPDCLPPHDRISIVEVPYTAPESARVVAMPVLFPDGGFPGVPGRTAATSGCHDITAYPAKGLAAGACLGQGVLFDITDPANPRIIDSVTDPNFAFWHSATFNNSATTVVFTDELGGGSGPTCNPTVGPNRGADGIYRIVDTPDGKRLQFASYFKIPRANANTENCVAHNGSLIPVIGRDVMVQAWYQGGVSVWEFTDPAAPREIAWFDRGPLSATELHLGGFWSAYWYNGLIYASDIVKGLDVFLVSDPAVLVGGLLNPATELNVQTQQPFRVH